VTATEPELVVVADPDAVASEAAERIAVALEAAVQARGQAHWATTGGSLAPPIYRALAGSPLRDRVPWADTHVWWGDDRFVPRDHPLSNVKPLDDILLAIGNTEGGQVGLGTMGAAQPVPLPINQRHPFPTGEAIGAGRDAAWCAGQLAAELEAAGLERDSDWPVFDLVVLGVGADGHVLSVFPDSAAFDADALALAVPAPTHIAPHVERVTLSPRVLGAARRIVLVATGLEKAPVIGASLHDEIDPRRLPAQLARSSNAVWVLDAAAAGELPTPSLAVSRPGPASAPG
jgi:6-phosphogluconolactonase